MRKSIKQNSEVKIKEASKQDAGRGILRIDPDVFKILNFRKGDIIEIYNSRTDKMTAAVLYPGNKEDSGINTIQMDQSLRRNIGGSIDDIVRIRKIEPVKANKIIFAGLNEVIKFKTLHTLVNKLVNRVITIGDILTFYSKGHTIDLIAEEFLPHVNTVRIEKDTIIILSELTHKDLLKNKQLIDKLKIITKEFSKIQLEELRDILDLKQREFDMKIFEWAKQFGFRIDGDYIKISIAQKTRFRG